jgi:DNA-binding transcriptional regulator LsrR (DeoR family)
MTPSDLVQTAAVARRYFLEDRSKLEIAEEFGLSRYKVARMLARARQSGLVRISIDFPDDLNASASHQLAAAYGLRHAFVVDTADRDDAVVEPLGRAGARLLEEIVEEGETLGIAMGRTLGSLTAQLHHLARCSVVQLTGALSTGSVDESSIELIRRVSSLNGGTAYPIYAPLYVSSPDIAAELRAQASVKEALDQHDRLTTAVVAIGSWRPPYSTVYTEISEADRKKLGRQGVVAELCTIMIDSNGQIVSSPLTDRLISISATQLTAIPNVIAVAGGPSKREAIAAALATGIINSLVTDTNTAHHLLRQQPPDDAGWEYGSRASGSDRQRRALSDS